MAMHPAIDALKQELEKRHKNADQYQDSGLYAAAYNERREANGIERAIAIIEPWLGGERGL
jgi:hypothetical protein